MVSGTPGANQQATPVRAKSSVYESQNTFLQVRGIFA
jgi:hypothetical protein